jgi:hypothetical protein
MCMLNKATLIVVVPTYMALFNSLSFSQKRTYRDFLHVSITYVDESQKSEQKFRLLCERTKVAFFVAHDVM